MQRCTCHAVDPSAWQIRYCNRKCQLGHWPFHRYDCPTHPTRAALLGSQTAAERAAEGAAIAAIVRLYDRADALEGARARLAGARTAEDAAAEAVARLSERALQGGGARLVEALTCPLTGRLFRDPVVVAGDPQGRSYEREALGSPGAAAVLDGITDRRLVPNAGVRGLARACASALAAAAPAAAAAAAEGGAQQSRAPKKRLRGA